MLRFWLTLTLLLAFIVSLFVGAAKAWGAAFPSPMLAYTSRDYNDATDIFVLDLSTGLAQVVPQQFFVSYATWSADGRLSFTADRYGYDEIFIWDGVTMDTLSQPVTYHSQHVWSRDGRLAFLSDLSGDSDIYIWDGTTIRNISESGNANDVNPIWLNDGRLTFTSVDVFISTRETLIWDGSTLTSIEQHEISSGNPVWSSDGRVAFSSHRDGNYEIYVWTENLFSTLANTKQRIKAHYGVMTADWHSFLIVMEIVKSTCGMVWR